MRYSQIISLSVLCSTLAGCGGGGNEIGPIDDIELSPSTVTLTGPPGACGAGTGPTIYIFGGFPPYKLYNSVPSQVTLNKAVVQKAGEGFVLTFLGGCLTNMPITVTDEAGKIATLSVNNVAGPTQ